MGAWQGGWKLIGHGANIKATNIDGETPLDLAKDQGKERVVELLNTHLNTNYRQKLQSSNAVVREVLKVNTWMDLMIVQNTWSKMLMMSKYQIHRQAEPPKVDDHEDKERGSGFKFLSSLSNENDNQQLDSSKDNGRSQLCLSSAEHGKSSDSAVHFVKENVGYLKNGVHLNSVQDGNVFKGVQLSNEL